MIRVNLIYADLVGMPYADMPCVALCNEVLRRLGLPRVAPETDEELADACEAVRSRVGRDEWHYLGNQASVATEPGDVIVTDRDQHLHTSVVVDVCPVMVLTSVERSGVIRVKASRLLGVVAVYRART